MLQFQSLRSFWAGGTEGNDRNCPGTERTGMCSSTHYTGDRQFRNAQTGSVACTTESISTALSCHHSSTHLYSCLIAMTIFWQHRAFELCCLRFRNKVNEVKCACFGRLFILIECDRQPKMDRKLQDVKVKIEGMQMMMMMEKLIGIWQLILCGVNFVNIFSTFFKCGLVPTRATKEETSIELDFLHCWATMVTMMLKVHRPA